MDKNMIDIVVSVEHAKKETKGYVKVIRFLDVAQEVLKRKAMEEGEFKILRIEDNDLPKIKETLKSSEDSEVIELIEDIQGGIRGRCRLCNTATIGYISYTYRGYQCIGRSYECIDCRALSDEELNGLIEKKEDEKWNNERVIEEVAKILNSEIS